MDISNEKYSDVEELLVRMGAGMYTLHQARAIEAACACGLINCGVALTFQNEFTFARAKIAGS